MEKKPLTVEVKDGELQISIGIDTLAWAAMHSPDERLVWLDDETEEYMTFGVYDELEFAIGVANEMENEEEDGTTPLHLFLDNMMVRAIEQGVMGTTDEPVTFSTESSE